MTGRFRSPGDYYKEMQSIRGQVDTMYNKVFVQHIGLDSAEFMALAVFREDPLVLADWSILSMVEQLTMDKKPGVLLTSRR